jgi:GntR family transcriptional regulator/MocR family aminotransferase
MLLSQVIKYNWIVKVPFPSFMIVPLRRGLMFWLGVTRKSEVPLIRQVYEQIRLKILQGELQPGERLLSTRGR